LDQNEDFESDMIRFFVYDGFRILYFGKSVGFRTHHILSLLFYIHQINSHVWQQHQQQQFEHDQYYQWTVTDLDFMKKHYPPKCSDKCRNLPNKHTQTLYKYWLVPRSTHTGFRLVPTSMTLNGVIALIWRYFTKFNSFAGRLHHSGWI